MLIYPLKGRVMVGTTDLEHDMREPAVCTEEEVDYFFDLIAHVFPAIRVDRSQIVYRFSGVRPLPRHDDTQPGFVSPRLPHRAGGCRGAPGHDPAEPRRRQVDHVPRPRRAPLRRGARAPRPRRACARRRASRSAAARATRRPTTPGASGSSRTATRSAAQRADELLERYGTRAEALLAEIEGERGGAARAPPRLHARARSRGSLRNERVVHLADLVLRRTSIAFTGALTAPLLDELADARRRRARLGAPSAAREVEATARCSPSATACASQSVVAAA